jgi:hypothetical protein
MTWSFFLMGRLIHTIHLQTNGIEGSFVLIDEERLVIHKGMNIGQLVAAVTSRVPAASTVKVTAHGAFFTRKALKEELRAKNCEVLNG